MIVLPTVFFPGRLWIVPSSRHLQKSDGRGWMAVVPDPVQRDVWLIGHRAKHNHISKWVRRVQLAAPLPKWRPAPCAYRNHNACEAAALMQVLLRHKDKGFTPREMFYEAFQVDPDDTEVTRVARVIGTFLGLGLVTCQMEGNRRKNIRFRLVISSALNMQHVSPDAKWMPHL